jgi:hypothetical protein
MILPLAQAELLKEFSRALFGMVDSEGQGWCQQIFEDAQVRNKVKSLKDEAYVAGPKGGARFTG